MILKIIIIIFHTLDIPGFFYLNTISYKEIMILSGIIKNKNKKILLIIILLKNIFRIFSDFDQDPQAYYIISYYIVS